MFNLRRREADVEGLDYTVALYGTLREGEGNFPVMEALMDTRHAVHQALCKIYGACIVDIGGLPGLYEDTGRVMTMADVYLISNTGLSVLDRFEGHPNFYCRKNMQLQMVNDEEDNWVGNVYMGPKLDIEEVPAALIDTGGLSKLCDWTLSKETRVVEYDARNHRVKSGEGRLRGGLAELMGDL